MEISKIKSKLGNLLGVFAFKILMELAYIYCIVVTWDNLQFYYTPNWNACILSYLYCAVIVLVIPEDDNKLSALICQFFTITSVVPYMIFYWTNNKSHWYALCTFCMVLIIFLLANRPGRGWVFEEKINRNTAAVILQVIFVGYVVAALWLCFKGGGIDLRALSFTDAYEIREEGTGLNILEEYLLQWSAKALTPFFMAYFLMYKKYLRCAACVVIQAVFYFTFGHKAFLLSIVLFVALYGLSKWFKKTRIMYSLSFGALAAVTFLYGIGARLKVFWVIAWQGVMRMFVEPAKIKFQYFDFFRERDKLLFSEGIIGKLFSLEYPFDKAIGYVISDFSSGGRLISNSNTGLIGDAYAQMGEFGMVLCGVLVGVLICVTDRVSTRIPIAYKIAMFSYICITLNDNALQTTLLTGGWVVMILMMLLLNSELYQKENHPDAILS